MKLIVLLAATLTVSSAFAASEFGGFKFHSSVPSDQIATLKNDITYLYKNPNTKPDKDFFAFAEITKGDGPELHNWLINRVRYIVGEKFQLTEENVITVEGYKFPSTPIPDAYSQMTLGAEVNEVKTVMSNMGAAYYLMGKTLKTLLGLNFDQEQVMLTSPRIGLLQVGEGLFFKDFQISQNEKSVANSVSRLGTLFHEARHSDGNSKNTGFLHVICPAGHPYAGYAACEVTRNGSYTIGGLSERYMVENCTACTTQERNILIARIADSFNRVVAVDTKTTIEAIQKQIETYYVIISSYRIMINRDASSEAKVAKYNAEIVKIQAIINQLEQDKKNISSKPQPPKMMDSTAEGKWTPVYIMQSVNMMEKSLSR